MGRNADIFEGLNAATPALRRYSRALSVDMAPGAADEIVQEALQSIGARIRKKDLRPADAAEARLAAYAALTEIASRKVAREERTGPRHSPIASALANLRFDDRAALLLVSLEGFGYEAAARIVGVSRETLLERLAHARTEFNADASSPDGGQRRPSHLRVVK